MNRILAYIIAGCLLAMVFPLSLRAQIAWCSPSEVRWGDTVKIYYNTQATKATLSIRDQVYANIYYTTVNGEYREASLKMMRRDAMFIGIYAIEDSVSEGRIAIHTPEKSIRVGDSFIALRKDGIPARGASISKIWNDSSAFVKEMVLYPDNFIAYASKWDYLQYGKKFNENSLKQVITNDVASLIRNNSTSPELYSALASAYKRLEKKTEYKEILLRMGKEFPLSPYTEEQLFRFSLQQYSDSSKWVIRALIRSIAAQFPTSSIARKMVERNFADTTLTLATTKTILDNWIAREPNSPEPYLAYIQLTQRTKPVPENTAAFAQYLLELIMKPEIRVRYQFNNNYMMGELFRYVSEAFTAAGFTGQALMTLKAARSYDFEAETRSEFLSKEGSLLLQSGQPTLAEEAFFLSYALGSTKAKDSALAVYKHLRGTDSGFATFIKQKTDSILGAKAKPALPFTVKALDGKTYDIAKLKGKAVVLNFWFIGCPPCRQEIPGLNTLVKEYAKKDVVFLALALDDEKSLNDFLKKTPFTYTIVPKAQNVSELYGVEGFPTHVILDRKGMNIGQLVGGSETRHEDLRPLIERALGQ
ncbi:MAG: TlpA family protein disulfide reductase [Candidatus Kapabacteria bacterium]|jgi:thiol-disulfide isomerase/thioredoxin|nr:TlpA family protein disulfide reductase [Candidatus Kapabacteria bacterium]